MPALFTDDFTRPDGFLDTNGWASGPVGPLYIYSGQVVTPEQEGSRSSGHSSTGVDYNNGSWGQIKLGDYPHGGANTATELMICGNSIGAGWLVRIADSTIAIAYRPTGTATPVEETSTAWTWQAGDLVKIAYNDPAYPGAAAHRIRVTVNSTQVAAIDVDSDDSLSLGNVVTLRIDASAGNAGSIEEMSAGSHDATTGVVTSVNGGNVAKSEGPFVVNGNDLENVTEVRVSDAGANPGVMTIQQQDQYSITCAPLNIRTSKFPYGTLRLEVDHPTEGTINHDFTMDPADGWQYVELASVNTAYMAKDIPGVVDGDLLEVPTDVAGSSITLFADSDTIYSPATQHGQTHTRWWFDDSAAAWDSGQVTIYRTDPGTPPTDPPVWTAIPSPPVAYSGVEYRYEIGNLLDGVRAITLTDVGTALPSGLSYDSTHPEAIVGTPAGQVGSTTTQGIVTLATNSEGAAESAPYAITVRGYPALSNPNASGITPNSAELRVTSDRGVGQLYLVADTRAQVAPGPAEIVAGEIFGGEPAQVTGGQPVVQEGVQGPLVVGQWGAATLVFYHMVQTAGDGVNYSNVVSGQFYTLNQDGTTVPEATPDTLVSFYTSNKSQQPPAGSFQNETTESSGTDPAEPSESQDGQSSISTKF